MTKEKFLIFTSLGALFFLIFLNLNFSQEKTFPQPISEKKPTSSFSQLLKEEKPVTLVAVGDVMLGRSVNTKMRTLNDFSYPFLKTADFLKQADLAFINLESAFYDPCPVTNTGMVFCADPKTIQGLVLAEVDIVNLANNHIRNYGQEGVDLTQKLLAEHGITPLGPEANLVIVNIEKTSFGFLGFDLTSSFDKEEIIEKVKKEQEKIDIFIVSLHWGQEYAKKPSSWQVELAHRLVEEGADLILGHHPHVIQEVETYQGVPIVYSLGNFIFDQIWSEETKRGLVGVFTFQDKKLVKSQFKKVYIQNLCQPSF